MVSHSLVLLGCIAGVQSAASNLSAKTGKKNIQSHGGHIRSLKSASEENLNQGLHGQYHLKTKGKYCEHLYQPIESITKCFEAAKKLGFQEYGESDYGETRPKGCFIHGDVAYFNTGIGGNATPVYQMVCEVGCVKYIGCYVDDWDRDLNEGPKAYGYDQSTCNTACKDYKYFSLQNGGQCFCGNAYNTTDKYVRKLDVECGDEGLGAPFRNSVFQTCVDWRCMKYIGCYVDDEDRDLKHGPQDRGYDSSTCNTACKDYKYYALQDGGYCSCGNAYNTTSKYVQKFDGECGDDRLGRGWRNAVFQTGSQTCVDTRCIKYIGCYVDDSDRDLKDGPKESGYDWSTCNVACKNYKYYALQADGHCRCGNAYNTQSKYEKKPDGECGDDRLGRGWRNAVFQTVSQTCRDPGGYKFSLRPETGKEHVTIVDGGIQITPTPPAQFQTLETKMEFVVKSSSITITYSNDSYEDDVFFWSNTPTIIRYLNAAKMREWRCGGSSEDERCKKVRKGDFHWSGTYSVSFLPPDLFEENPTTK